MPGGEVAHMVKEPAHFSIIKHVVPTKHTSWSYPVGAATSVALPAVLSEPNDSIQQHTPGEHCIASNVEILLPYTAANGSQL